jgi:hypothetical protein
MDEDSKIRAALSTSQSNQKLLIVQMRKLIKELDAKSEHVKRLEKNFANERSRSKRYREECARAWMEVEEAKVHESMAKTLVTTLKVEMNKLKVSFGKTLQELSALRSSKRRSSSSSSLNEDRNGDVKIKNVETFPSISK